jgi:hypothetical protein
VDGTIIDSVNKIESAIGVESIKNVTLPKQVAEAWSEANKQELSNEDMFLWKTNDKVVQITEYFKKYLDLKDFTDIKVFEDVMKAWKACTIGNPLEIPWFASQQTATAVSKLEEALGNRPLENVEIPGDVMKSWKNHLDKKDAKDNKEKEKNRKKSLRM